MTLRCRVGDPSANLADLGTDLGHEAQGSLSLRGSVRLSVGRIVRPLGPPVGASQAAPALKLTFLSPYPCRLQGVSRDDASCGFVGDSVVSLDASIQGIELHPHATTAKDRNHGFVNVAHHTLAGALVRRRWLGILSVAPLILADGRRASQRVPSGAGRSGRVSISRE
jgi:hypothetical protein